MSLLKDELPFPYVLQYEQYKLTGDIARQFPIAHDVPGDPDHPVNRGTLCPKGAGVMDMIQSPNRVKFPQVREPGSNEWKRISWDDALTRVAKHMKADRDANFIEKNDKGVTVNRWNTTALLASSAASNGAKPGAAIVARHSSPGSSMPATWIGGLVGTTAISRRSRRIPGA